jgi:FkbM family methyltransferase
MATVYRTARYLYRATRRFGLRRALTVWWSLHLAVVGAAGARAVQVSAPGPVGRLWVRPGSADPSVYDRILLRQALALDFCPQGRKLLTESAASSRAQIVIDAGAYVGYSSIALALMFPKARVLAIEPHAENFEALKRNVQSFPNIEPIRAALWDRRGAVGIVEDGSADWAVRVSDTPGKEAIPAVTVRDLMARDPGAELLAVKVVIEGAERQVFSADTDWLDEARLVVWMPADWRLPQSGGGRAAIRALAPYDFDYVIRDECLFCFKDPESGGLTKNNEI